MSGYLLAFLGVAGGLLAAAIGDMMSEEVRDRLDHLPHAILRLAARRLDATERAAIYESEWLPELTYILQGDEARPVSRVYHGVRFALGILMVARRIARNLNRTAPLMGHDSLAVGLSSAASDMTDRPMGVPASLASAPALEVITVRSDARRLNNAIADAITVALSIRNSDFAQESGSVCTSAIAIIGALDRASGHLANLGPEFHLDLDRDFKLARRLTDALVSGVQSDPKAVRLRCQRLSDDLAAARFCVSDLVLALGQLPVEASGADLSLLRLEWLRDLHGVTWTSETKWPPAIAGRLLAYSTEQLPGVYTIAVPYRPPQSLA